MLTAYLRLRVAAKRAAWRHSGWAKAGLIIKYLFLARVLAAAVWVGPSSQSAEPLATLNLLSQRGIVALALVAAAVLLAHFDIQLAVPFPGDPFRRFSSRRIWLLRSYLFPLFGSPAIISLVCLVSIFRASGVIYFAMFYLTFVLALRQPAFRIAGVAGVVLASLAHLSGIAIEVSFAAMAAVAIDFDARHIDDRSRPVGRLTLPGESIFVRKEIAAFRAFSSDQVFFVLALAASVLLVLMVGPEAPEGDSVPDVFWLIPWMLLLPFTRILFNLFGTDMTAWRRLLNAPARTAEYLIQRARYYQPPIYALQALAVIPAWHALRDAQTRLSYALGAIAFTEMVLALAVLYSARFPRPKVRAYHYGRQLLEINIRFSVVLYVIVAATILAVYSRGGLPGIALLTAGIIYVNTFHLGTGVARILSWQSKSRAHVG